MWHKLVVVAASFAAFGVAAAPLSVAPIVKTDSGRLSGAEKDGVKSFLGIPYAAPPTGDLRWRAP